MKKLLLILVLACSLFSGLAPAQTTTNFDISNGVVYVRSGGFYPLSATGINNAISSLGTNGGKVIISPTAGTAVNMGSTPVNVPSNVCLVGAGWGATVLEWTVAPVSAAITFNQSQQACLHDLQIQFSSGVKGTGIELIGSDSAQAYNDNIHDVFINFLGSAPTAGSLGIYGNGSGPNSTDIVLNHFYNILMWQADQAINCNSCEGNYWDVTSQRTGATSGVSRLVQFSGKEADEKMTLRIEVYNTGSVTCLYIGTSGTGTNNTVNLTCDGDTSTTIIDDVNGYNIYQLDGVGSPALGTLQTTSRYMYVNSGTGGSTTH